MLDWGGQTLLCQVGQDPVVNWSKSTCTELAEMPVTAGYLMFNGDDTLGDFQAACASKNPSCLQATRMVLKIAHTLCNWALYLI